ncbi:MAG: hypothetical protein QGH60_23210 [Phycisphaerae bacterium]|jgi:hypothetical protein|nr:hypothetical protein [Phycisphaerae bacterium]
MRRCLVFAAGIMVFCGAAAGDIPRRIVDDWLAQDANSRTGVENRIVAKVLAELGDKGAVLRKEAAALRKSDNSGTDALWRDLYIRACDARRAARLAPMLTACRKIVFTKHHIIPSSNIFYTEALSDAQNQRNFAPNSALCLLTMQGAYGKVRTLLTDAGGVIRDPDVSYDGQRILFAWKKSRTKDDYHLYEMSVASGKITQITSGLGLADFDGKYLPTGEIIFNSTRCIQSVDCNFPEVSNLYVCRTDGKHMRRVGFDQVHTSAPSVLDDGRVIYTRWDYNDRGQVFTQPLFQMNADGTGQTEFYGNNSWFPTSIQFARGIPGTRKVVAILPGHHTRRAGKLAIIDPTRGRQEASGVQLIAPIRRTEAARVDRYGQKGELFRHPYALSEKYFIVGYSPEGWKKESGFGLYFFTADGRRELLAWDDSIPCSQPVPLAPRRAPQRRASMVDYRKSTGIYAVQNVYAGPGLKGVTRGAAKKLRVIALEFRALGIGKNSNRGPAGRAMVTTPIAIDNGSWDVKRLLGDVPIEADGSACFEVPARTPVYFQIIDERGCAIQTMRSWSTLQPGEKYACIGCHENKNETTLSSSAGATIAARKGPRKLIGFYGPPRGFSFPKEIQPILDKHCIRCHDGQKKTDANRKSFSLLSKGNVDRRAKRVWSDSYLALTKRGKQTPLANWISPQSGPSMLPPYHAGAAKSKLITILEKTHEKAKLSREELDKFACWLDLLVPYCGDYREANAWSDAEKRKYDHFEAKRKKMQAAETKNIQQLLTAQASGKN